MCIAVPRWPRQEHHCSPLTPHSAIPRLVSRMGSSVVALLLLGLIAAAGAQDSRASAVASATGWRGAGSLTATADSAVATSTTAAPVVSPQEPQPTQPARSSRV